MSDPYRPLLHFAPRRHWVNDPNGLVFHEGRWHLFFQHNPNGDGWGDMSWGHAVSDDLVSWDERPVAIRQSVDADGQPVEHVFSGSAVHDGDDLVAIYTSVRLSADPDDVPLQTQHLARSTDDGETWVKDPANPVLDRGSTDFRDPKVFRDGDRWVMAAVEAIEQKVVLYASDDLRTWTLLSEFADPSLQAGPWECPDLFPLAVEGSGEVRWVLLVSVLDGAPGGGSGMRWWVGDFDGTDFTPEARRLAGPRARLLRRRHLQRRPRRPAGDDRLAGQLGLRAPDPHRRLARRDDAPARPDPGGHRRRSAPAPGRGPRAGGVRAPRRRAATGRGAPAPRRRGAPLVRRRGRRAGRSAGAGGLQRGVRVGVAGARPARGRGGHSRGVAGPVLGRGVRRRWARGAELPGVPQPDSAQPH